MLIICFGN